jgi:hypothetical protein
LHRFLCPLLNAAIVTVFSSTVPAAGANISSLIGTIRQDIQPQSAMTTMQQVYTTDRFFTFSAFGKTASYLDRRLRDAGLTEVEVVQTPADGKTQFGFWTMPLAWQATSARLEMLNDRLPTDARVLAEYPRIPASLGMWSGSTPAGGIETEIMAVSRTELEGGVNPDINGKLVLTDFNPAGFKSALVKAGALGAMNAFTENSQLLNGRQWINAWGDSGWGFTKTSTPLLSFSITPTQTRLVRELLAVGPVRVRATVDTRYSEGSYPYVTGLVRGVGPEEVLALAHTSEQGAHDNATGVAATLEAVTTLNRLIANGKLPRPRRSIRILLMPEMYGSMHYVASNPERIRRTVAAMCVDTPAASYELAGTEYSFHMNPHVAKSFTDALILQIAETYFPLVKRPWHEKPFTTGTDTYLAEPMIGVPTVWSYSGSGVETHHNSEDTPDRVDVRSLRDLSIVTAAYLYTTANAGNDDAQWLADLSETRGYQQIIKRAERLLDPTTRPTAQADEELAYAVGREQQAVSSVLRLVSADQRTAVEESLRPALARLESFGEQQKERVREAIQRRAGASQAEGRVEPSRLTVDAANIVVRRKRFGTIPLDDLPVDRWEGQPSGAWAAVPTIALYWCDGKRNLAEVARLTQLELGPTNFNFVAYFRFLRKNGYVYFVSE